MDVNKLLKALDDETNEDLLNFTTEKIKQMTLEVLGELQLTKQETTNLFKKLENYKYVDEMNDLKYGSYIRWIPIENPNNIYLDLFLYYFKSLIYCKMYTRYKKRYMKIV
jgi:hypothetical protein